MWPSSPTSALDGLRIPHPSSRIPPVIALRLDDLAFVTTQAFVWPVSAELHAPTPLLRRFEIAAGPSLARQLAALAPLPVGSAVVTGAGELDAEFLISAVVSSDEEPVTRAGVRRALTSALHRAADWQIEHLAVTPFGLGAGNLDIEESAEIMLDTFARHATRSASPASITIVLESPLEEEAFASRMVRSA
ncbi:MAG TPA: macro domain-containing protein [Gemmatimonadaceae bacterium]|nr:macro domain-containing protein [Gemmatimonadaceae bacterium]